MWTPGSASVTRISNDLPFFYREFILFKKQVSGIITFLFVLNFFYMRLNRIIVFLKMGIYRCVSVRVGDVQCFSKSILSNFKFLQSVVKYSSDCSTTATKEITSSYSNIHMQFSYQLLVVVANKAFCTGTVRYVQYPSKRFMGH